MARKRLLVEVDENQWAMLKGQAAAEGRFVRVLLGEAIGAYLASRPSAPAPDAPVAGPVVSNLELLKVLVASVPAGPHQEPPSRPETTRERLERESARREWLRTHPEEEGQ